MPLPRGTICCGLQYGTTRYAYDTSSPEYFSVEILEVGGGDHGLRTLQEILGEVLSAALVELAHHVVEEEDGIIPHLPPHVVPGRKLERKRRQPLLPLRPERGEVYPAERDLEVVPVRTHRGRPALDVGAVRLSERLGVLIQCSAMPVADRGLLGAVQGP